MKINANGLPRDLNPYKKPFKTLEVKTVSSRFINGWDV
jgi:hypothetical protein